MENDLSILKLSKLERRELLPGGRARFVHTQHMTLAFWEFDAGVQVPEHAHPHEQVTTILGGIFDLTVGGEIRHLRAGMVVVIPPDMPHSASAVTAVQLLDTFYPAREDLR